MNNDHREDTCVKVLGESPHLQVVRIPTAGLFLDYLRPWQPRWDDGHKSHWIFRGQANAEWRLSFPSRRPDALNKLRPLILRAIAHDPRMNIDEFDLVTSDPELLKKNAQQVFLYQSWAECLAIREFAELGDELGLGVVNHGEVDEWSRHWGEMYPSEYMALAQHHGIPTLLLDWTSNPVCAAYFATEASVDAKDVAVWALNTRRIERFNQHTHTPNLVLFRSPRASCSFLHAQDGVFLWCHNQFHLRVLEQKGRWATVEDTGHLFELPDNCPALRKIVLPQAQVPVLRRMLWREQISRAHLMPTYDNVSRQLFQRWEDESFL